MNMLLCITLLFGQAVGGLGDSLIAKYRELPRTSYEVMGLCNALYHDCRTDLIKASVSLRDCERKLRPTPTPEPINPLEKESEGGTK